MSYPEDRIKFGVSSNSLDAQLEFMPKEIRDRYHKNKKAYYEDRRYLELWALDSFMSGRMEDFGG